MMAQNRRRLLRVFLASISTLLSFIIAPTGRVTPPQALAADNSNHCETRAVWLNPPAFNSGSRREQTMRYLVKANFNTIFIQAPEIDGNLGVADHDDFVNFVQTAKTNGMSVQMWIMSHRRTGKEIDFRKDSEQAAQKQWVLGLLAKYGDLVDGIHLDYIRYDDWESVNVNGKMDAIKKTIAGIKAAMAGQYPDKQLTATSFTLEPQWEESYRNPPYWEEDVPEWFKTWYADNPGSIYDGAITRKVKYIGVPVHMKFQQDPMSWLTSGSVDAILPMQYSYHEATWNNEAAYWKRFFKDTNQNPDNLIMGVGWLDPEGHSDWGWQKDKVVSHIEYGRSIGLTGFSIFQIGAEVGQGQSDADLINLLKDGPFANPTTSCLRGSTLKKLTTHTLFLPLVLR